MIAHPFGSIKLCETTMDVIIGRYIKLLSAVHMRFTVIYHTRQCK